VTAKDLHKLPIAVSMTARNEAHNLPRSLGSVRDWVQEIVVVVNDCTDGTVEIARGYEAKVIEHPWEGYRDQKRFALSQVAAPWVLALDADEEVSDVLREDIFHFFENDHERFAGAMFPRKVWFMGRWITHGDWYPDWSLRLFRRGLGQWEGSPEHDKIVLRGPCQKLRGDLHHYSNPTLVSHVDKIAVFSDYFLQRQIERGRRWSAFETVFRPWWRFLRAYVLRRGFLDGYPGYYIAKATAFATLVRYSRLYEYEKSSASVKR
jgi:glycosyltransferase involved in cell wall biosynthesis